MLNTETTSDKHRLTIEEAKQLSILEVAESLGMEMKRNSSQEYYWEEHDSLKINTRKNSFKWYSQDIGGDVIKLVETVKNVNFREAMHFLSTGEFHQQKAVEAPKGPFKYGLGLTEHQSLAQAITFLKDERGLSEDTIQFFIDKGVLAQATKRDKDGYSEPVVVFKSLDQEGKIIGASLQGINEDRQRYDRGRRKQIMYNSDGMAGLSVDIGQPKRLVFAEAPIDLMSYYEANKDSLRDVRLVAMDGLKEATISRYYAELYAELTGREMDVPRDRLGTVLAALAKSTHFQNPEAAERITLAIDYDDAARNFIINLRKKGIVFQTDIPARLGLEKNDWNDELKIREKIQKETEITMSQEELQETTQQTENLETAQQLLATQKIEDQINNLIEEMTKDDTSYYLWHDESLDNLELPDAAMEEFHERLVSVDSDHRYQGENYALYVEESINDGATGYLSLDGNVIDEDGLRDYIQSNFETNQERLNFLEGLVQPLKETWKATQEAYDAVFNQIVAKYSQEQKEKAPGLDQELKMDRSNVSTGSLQQNAEGSPEPVADATFEQTVTSHPTASYPLLHFSTNKERVSIRKSEYHIATEENINKLNLFAAQIQDSAQWYLNNIADTKLYYIMPDESSVKVLRVDYNKDKFMHLAGIHLVDNQNKLSAADALVRLVEGKGNVDNILLSNSFEKKIKVMPMIKAIASTDYFVFDDLSEVQKFGRMHSDTAIRSNDEDMVLALKSNNDTEYFPASLMKSTKTLNFQMDETQSKNAILGVYRERDGQIEQLSINEKFIKDGGKEMFDIIKNHELEPTYTPTVDPTIQEDKAAQLDPEAKPRNVFDQGRDAVTDFLERMRARNRQKAEEEQLKAENKDSDLDGLSDKLEMGYGTNPHSADTDGDGLSDTQEVSQGTNPLEPNQATSQPIPAPQIVPAQPSLEALIAAKDTKGLSQHLKDGIKDYFNSDVYKNYLNAMSKMNNYSSNNLRLLVAQNPNVSAVASFNQWKELGRHIKKGEKGLKVWAPSNVKLKDEKGQPILDEQGQEKTALRFFLTTVFDVSQTQGKDLPKQIYELTGDAQDFQDLFFSIKRAAEDKGVKVGWGELEKGNGYFDPEANQIMVKSGMSPAQTIKTVLHELVHSRLHADGSTDFDSAEYAKQELQAESIAYVVANHYNIDTSDYSFAYLASWSQSQEGLAEFEAQLSTIQKEAKSLMNEIDSKLEQIKNKSVAQDKFHEKLAQHKQEQATKQVPEASKEKAQDDPKKSHGL